MNKNDYESIMNNIKITSDITIIAVTLNNEKHESHNILFDVFNESIIFLGLLKNENRYCWLWICRKSSI